MNKIFLTGDTHRDFRRFNSKSFPEGKELNKNDYMIILGDFGLFWDSYISDDEKYWTKCLENKKFTTLFIDGNHENHVRLNKLPTIKKFNNEVGVVSDNIYHLKRGRIYTINDKTFFVMGGGFSIDKAWRTEGKSWWPEEMPSKEEYEIGKKNLKKVNHKVDYILSHTCSNREFNKLKEVIYLDGKIGGEEELRDYLEWVIMTTEYKHHYFGHFHCNEKFDRFSCLYYDKEEI